MKTQSHMSLLALLSFAIPTQAVCQSHTDTELEDLMSGLGFESEATRMQVAGAIFWFGDAPIDAPSAVRQVDGTIAVSTEDFTVILSADGEIVERLPTLDNIAEIGGLESAPYSAEYQFLPLIRQNSNIFERTEAGSPLPPGGLEADAIRAREACIMESEEAIKEARLMDVITSTADSSDPGMNLAMRDMITSKFLAQGVSLELAEQATDEFIVEAHRRKSEREARYDAAWRRLIYGGPSTGDPEAVEFEYFVPQENDQGIMGHPGPAAPAIVSRLSENRLSVEFSLPDDIPGSVIGPAPSPDRVDE